QGVKVVDISADYRLKDVAIYEQWYGVVHPSPEFLPEAVYGLPELHRAEISWARLIANPGCYPTGAILGLLPALPFIGSDVIIDSKSGISGGGRTLSLTNHYSEVNESCQAYALEGHRHLPEIEQELALAQSKLGLDRSLRITFLPHLVPMTRGILSTIYAPLAQPLSAEEVRQRYQEYYAEEPFVRVVSKPPQTKQTWGSNLCIIHPTVDSRTDRLIVVSCLDNLVKGAAGQAIQNMNLMFGLDETIGLGALPVFP
ncbi:MAG: N-acetyl-gamma-glutamyl-phosphate reductase, partial [Chloroflexi bacterium]|nr:N-acetyl-gamma-glutamyl-phosphate reductase [Chloroflexota bacterium]